MLFPTFALSTTCVYQLGWISSSVNTKVSMTPNTITRLLTGQTKDWLDDILTRTNPELASLFGSTVTRNVTIVMSCSGGIVTSMFARSLRAQSTLFQTTPKQYKKQSMSDV